MNTAALATALKDAMDTAMEAAQDPDADPAVIRQAYADSVASAMETFVKTLSITIGTGAISVSGPGAVSTNPAPIVIIDTPPNSLD